VTRPTRDSAHDEPQGVPAVPREPQPTSDDDVDPPGLIWAIDRLMRVMVIILAIATTVCIVWQLVKAAQ